MGGNEGRVENRGRKIGVTVVVALAACLALFFALEKSKKLPGIEAAFYYAGRNDQVRLDELLRRKPGLASRPNKDGYTLLHEAADNADVPVAKVLLDRGANVNALDRQGKTPLDRAQAELLRAITWKYNPGEARKMVALLKAHGGKGTTGSAEASPSR